MDDLKWWVRKNMVVQHYGDFVGLRDLTITELNDLERLVQNAKKPRLVADKSSESIKVPLRPA